MQDLGRSVMWSANEMSYSMQVDESDAYGSSPPDDGHFHELKVRARNIETWVPDDAVSTCYACGTAFGWYLRKHHCRACGRIFCYKCSDNTDVLPRDLERYPTPNGTAEWLRTCQTYLLHTHKSAPKERTCDKCHRRLQRTQDIWIDVRIFDLLELDLQALRTISLVCKRWCRASLCSLSAYREIQYRLPMQQLSERERQQLWINRRFLVGHSVWSLQLVRACLDEPQKMPEALEIAMQRQRRCLCWTTMCSRYCRTQWRTEDALQLLQLPKSAAHLKLRRFAVRRVRRAPETLFRLLSLHLVHAMRWDSSEARQRETIEQVLLERCQQALGQSDCSFPVQVYWYLQMNAECEHGHLKQRYADALEKLENSFPSLLLEQVQRGKQLLNKNPKRLGDTAAYVPCVLPALPEHVCVGVDAERVRVKRSATRPALIPLQVQARDTVEAPQERTVLYKLEDVRGDAVVSAVIAYMDLLLKTEEQLDLGILTYNVTPISASAGLIEIVPKAETLYYVRYALDQSLLNYLLEHNPNKTIEEVRRAFVRSTAAYCVITFLLGVGDRHLENIMLTTDGRLFHIDYGFLMGQDPRPIAAPQMRISEDMVDAIGGIRSEYYSEFQALCTRIYNCLRRHVLPIATMLQLLQSTNAMSEEYLRQQILTRFSPGENHIEAQLQLSTRLEDSRSSTYGPTIDFLHHSSLTASRTLKQWLQLLWRSDDDL